MKKHVSLWCVRMLIGIVALRAVPAVGQGNPNVQDRWIRTSDRSTPRIEHQAVTLRDGRVLVLGGYNFEALDGGTFMDSAELYEPRTDTWTPAAHMPAPAGFQWAAVLKSGRVLACGNFDSSDFSPGTFSAIYDPLADTWSSTPPLPIGMANAHAYMPAVALSDGRVLIAGGTDSSSIGPSDVALIFTPDPFNPGSGSWDYTRSNKTGLVTKLHKGRESSAIALLNDGRMLHVGGVEFSPITFFQSSRAADLFDPRSGEWTALPDMPPIPGERGDDINTVNPGSRWAPAAQTLPDGRVLVAGGLEFGFDGTNLFAGRRRSVVIFDPRDLQHPWSIAAPMGQRRWFARSATVRSGQGVFVVGGGFFPFATEIYDPVSGSWSFAAEFFSIDAFGSQLNPMGGNFLLTGGFDVDTSPDFTQFGSVKSLIYIPGLPAQAVGPKDPPDTDSVAERIISQTQKLYSRKH